MSSFTFPPPPPPAPVSATNSTYGSYGNTAHHGSSNSRGRGGYRGRSTYGRGNNQAWEDYRGAFNNNHHNTTIAQYAASPGTGSIRNQQPAYGSEVASGQPATVTQAQAQTNAYNWLYQSMHMYSQTSALATQYQGHGTEIAPAPLPIPGTHTQWSPMSKSGTFKQSHHNPHDDIRGIKRKRGDFQSSRRGGQHRQSPSQFRLGNITQVAPAIPSFGFSLPTSVQETATLVEGKNNQPSAKKQKHNLLGLTPQLAENENDDEEYGMDEEASGMSTGAGLRFEHNGQIATLKTEKEIAAWIAERKKRYPTKARIAQKNAEALKKRQAIEEARERALKTTKSQESTAEKKKDADGKEKANKHLKKAEKLRAKLKAAEAKTAKAMIKDGSNYVSKPHCGDTESLCPEISCIKEDIKKIQDKNSSHPSRQQVINKPNLGLDYSSTSPSASSSRESSPLSLSSPETSDSSSSVSVSASSHSSSLPLPASKIDTAYPAPSEQPDRNGSSPPYNPEYAPEITKESNQGQAAVPQQSTNKGKRPCKFFLKSGRCRNGEKCKFSHDMTPRRKKRQDQNQNQNQNRRRQLNQKGGRDQSEGKYITLSERLQMQEQREREQYLLQVIKDMGQRGILEPC